MHIYKKGKHVFCNAQKWFKNTHKEFVKHQSFSNKFVLPTIFTQRILANIELWSVEMTTLIHLNKFSLAIKVMLYHIY